MARKRTLNRRDYRSDFDESEEGRKKEEEGDEEEVEEEEDDDEEDEEAEAKEDDEEEAEPKEDDDGDEEEAPKKKPKAAKKPAKAPRVKKPRAGKIVRMRVVWGVFDNSNRKVASFEYKQEAEAREKAAQLGTEKKQTFFVQPVKEAIPEEKVP